MADDKKDNKSNNKSTYRKDYKKKDYDSKYKKSTYKKSTYNRKENNLTLDYALRHLSGFNGDKTKLYDSESQGRFVQIPTVSRISIQTSTTEPRCVIFNPSMNGVNQIMSFSTVTGAGWAAMPSPASQLASEHPTTSRCLFSSVKLYNTTENQHVSGTVRGLTLGNMEYEFVSSTSFNVTTAFAAECAEMARGHPRARTITGKLLQEKEHELVLARCSESDAHIYKEFKTATAVADWQQQFIDSKLYQSHNTLLILFEPTATVNEYELCVSWVAACRYPQNSIVSHLSGEAMSSSPDFQKNLNKLVNDDTKLWNQYIPIQKKKN